VSPTLASVDSGGSAAAGDSGQASISGDGSIVTFASVAADLASFGPPLPASGPNADLAAVAPPKPTEVYAHDLVTGITELVSRTPGGRPANGPSLRPALSHDGATVAFQSLASNLVCEGTCQGGQPDINLVWDVFVSDRFARRTARVSTDIGEEWMENSRAPSLDDAGQVLAFGSRHPINRPDRAHDENLYVYRLHGPLRESR